MPLRVPLTTEKPYTPAMSKCSSEDPPIRKDLPLIHEIAAVRLLTYAVHIKMHWVLFL
jgi:hypothetical protein